MEEEANPTSKRPTKIPIDPDIVDKMAENAERDGKERRGLERIVVMDEWGSFCCVKEQRVKWGFIGRKEDFQRGLSVKPRSQPKGHVI